MPPALLPALALLAGALAGTSFDASFRAAVPLLPIACVAAAVAWRRQAGQLAFGLTLCGFACGGAVLAAVSRDEALHPELRSVLDCRFGDFIVDGLGPEGDHDPLRVRAVLREDAAIRDDYVSMRVAVVAVRAVEADLKVGPYDWLHDWQAVEGGVALTVSGDAAAAHAAEWRAGRVIEAPATFRRPARYLNTGVPDFERQLALDGTTLFGSIKSALLIDVVARGSRFEEWTARVRARVRAAIDTWVAPHNPIAAAIVTAVLIGDRTGLSDEVNDRLQRAGTYHVIAISGGNIAILAGLALGLLALIGIHGRARAVLVIAVLLVYAQIAITGPSVWRATMMAVVYLTARLLDHRTPAWQAIALAAGVMATVAPLDVRSAGFILTFGATAALLESAHRMRGLFIRFKPDNMNAGKAGSTKDGVLLWTAASIGASIAVELALMPVSAESFSRVTLAGPLLNLAAVPLMAVAQVAGLVVAAFNGWPVVAQPAGWLAAASASSIVESAGLVDVAPAFSWRVSPPGLLLLAFYYASLLGLLFTARPRLRLAAAPVFVVAWLSVTGVIPSAAPSAAPGIRLTVFDVGQGEAMLLESGTSRLQIDAGGAPFGGGSFDIGARVVAPALWARGIGRLDALLVTHGDPDHIGGARVLLESFTPRRLWEGVVVPRHEPSRQLRDRAVSTGAGVELRRAGESFPWGVARIRVLHPPEPDWERPRVRNDDSVVLEVTCGDVALLLTGDVGEEVERAIAPLLTPARTRILKVGHHGSRTSSSRGLLEGWRPQIAFISAGRGNTFGHPTPEVLERLASIGAQVYRTDRHGQITLESDCRNAVVRTFAHEG